MKRLLLKLTLLTLPFVTYLLIEASVLPMNTFTFRVWETISVNSMQVMSGPFYPNMHVKMAEEGELAPRTPYAEKRLVEWYTDAYGYRNKDTKCDILLIGDSNITGVKLTQEETLADVLERCLQKEVYSFAPATMNRFLATERFIQNPPEMVIVSSIERRIPDLPAIGANGLNSKLRNFSGDLINSSSLLTSLFITADRLSKLSLYRRTLADMERHYGVKKYIQHDNEFFLEGEYANRTFSDEEITRMADVIASYKQVLDEKGIRFMFMPIPNKENIYYNLLPSGKKPDFLPRLMAELTRRKVEVVDLQNPFEQLYHEQNIPLYPADDAHWNEIAVEKAAGIVANKIKNPDTDSLQKKDNHLVKFIE
ncbi:alginate O-acetyltransferase AlgX-related protein [Pontibacter sp. 13R65]|uniref:alginate O-acetyltransferase AlgX-related protein n=1 Tax=Pontibacter sp. 13R65 TaxID=3127458 RepID=UPI00301D9E65